jgi:hypothetical protein
MVSEEPKKGKSKRVDNEFTRNAEMRVSQEYKKGKETSKDIYQSTPMKNRDIDYIKGKEIYKDGTKTPNFSPKGQKYN